MLAAPKGIVTYVKTIPILGVQTYPFGITANFIVIMHSHGEYSRYDHLKYHSAKVKIGQKVIAEQEIAKVGMTGYTFIPHLHFQVFIFTGYNIWADFF